MIYGQCKLLYSQQWLNNSSEKARMSWKQHMLNPNDKHLFFSGLYFYRLVRNMEHTYEKTYAAGPVLSCLCKRTAMDGLYLHKGTDATVRKFDILISGTQWILITGVSNSSIGILGLSMFRFKKKCCIYILFFAQYFHHTLASKKWLLYSHLGKSGSQTFPFAWPWQESRQGCLLMSKQAHAAPFQFP